MLPDPSQLSFVDPEQLHTIEDYILIDVRTPEAYSEVHLVGARNICIYETAFPDALAEHQLTADDFVVVYGENATFKAAELAAHRLENLGFSNVSVLRGGLQACRERTQIDLEEGERPDRNVHGLYFLDNDKSKLRWIGRNLMNQHHGEVRITSGQIELDEKGEPLSGTITVDMNDISCDDISDTGLNKMLVQHLSSIDFFDTENYPEAHFETTQFQRLQSSNGSPNFELTGTLRIRGKEEILTIPAAFTETMGTCILQANFDLDRTSFGVLYGSDKFFERLGMHLVNNLVYLQVTAVFKR